MKRILNHSNLEDPIEGSRQWYKTIDSFGSCKLEQPTWAIHPAKKSISSGKISKEPFGCFTLQIKTFYETIRFPT